MPVPPVAADAGAGIDVIVGDAALLQRLGHRQADRARADDEQLVSKRHTKELWNVEAERERAACRRKVMKRRNTACNTGLSSNCSVVPRENMHGMWLTSLNASGSQSRVPKIALPTRTWVAPNCDGGLEIGAHAHAEPVSPCSRASLARNAKCTAGSSSCGGNAHEAGDLELQLVAAQRDQRGQLGAA